MPAKDKHFALQSAAATKAKSFTDESAVTLDGLKPIHVPPAGEKVEWADCGASWGAKDAGASEPVG